MARPHCPPEVQNWIEIAKKAGWRVVPTKKSHFAFYPPDKTLGLITVEGTPSDHRSVKNTRARLRAAGLPI